jgi:hypothetical protein
MLVSRTPRHGRALLILATALCAVLAASLVPAVADTIFPPGTGDFTVKVTVNGTIYSYPDGGPGPTIPNVADGDDVTIDIADSPGGPDVNFARLRARQCAGDREVSNNTEFNPFVTNRCSSVTLGAGSTNAFVDSGPVAPGTTALSVAFKIGEGTAPDVEDPVFGTNLPGFTCGAGNPCKIVVNAEVTTGIGSSNYLGFPITLSGPASVPGAPGTPTAVAGDASAAVSWTAPVSDGGSAITSYLVTSAPGGQTCTWTTGPLSCTVNGLTNGTAYTFTVQATNGVGQGAASAASNAVTPGAPAGDLFTGVTPKRLLDSRPAFQVGPFNTPWGPATSRDVTVAGGTTTVPADADAVTLNVTVTQTNAVSYLSIWPKGETQPTVSSLNWDAGWTVPNAVTVKVGTGGQISIYNNLGSANVIVDVVGYYKAGSGAGFTSLQPKRLLDSRPSFQVGPYSTPWSAGTNRDVIVAGGTTTVPSDAEAVVLNVTVTQTNAVSYLSVWPSGQVQPTVSSLNWDAGWTIPNAVTAKVGTSGQIRIYNNLGTTNVLADVAGWYG